LKPSKRDRKREKEAPPSLLNCIFLALVKLHSPHHYLDLTHVKMAQKKKKKQGRSSNLILELLRWMNEWLDGLTGLDGWLNFRMDGWLAGWMMNG
jgi:hypothetical protein